MLASSDDACLDLVTQFVNLHVQYRLSFCAILQTQLSYPQSAEPAKVFQAMEETMFEHMLQRAKSQKRVLQETEVGKEKLVSDASAIEPPSQARVSKDGKFQVQNAVMGTYITKAGTESPPP